MKRIQLENRTDLKNEIPLESPYVIFIDPSSACNFKCKFCMNHKIKNPKIMDSLVYKKIIDDLQEFETPIKTIRLYGFGEPLFNKNFCDMVVYAKKSNKVISVDTTTNASMLSPELIIKLVESGIDRINISINGLSDIDYKNFTGQQINFKNLVANISNLYDIKKDSTIVFIKINGDNLTPEQKGNFFDIFKPISDGCAIEYCSKCWYDTDIPNVNTEIGIYGQPLEDIKVCPYIFYTLVFQSSGESSICFLDWDKRMLIGDVRKKSVKQIWNSPILKKFQIEMLKGYKTHICSDCGQLRSGMPTNLDFYANDILMRIK